MKGGEVIIEVLLKFKWMNYILKRLPNPDMIKFQNSVVILFLVFLIYDLNDLKIKIRMG